MVAIEIRVIFGHQVMAAIKVSYFPWEPQSWVEIADCEQVASTHSLEIAQGTDNVHYSVTIMLWT